MLNYFNNFNNYILVLFVEIGFISSIMGGSKMVLSISILVSEINFLLILLGILGSSPIYILDRIKMSEEDKKSIKKQQRSDIISEYKIHLLVISLILYSTYIYLCITNLTVINTLLVNIQIISIILYDKTKDYLIIDTILIAFTWSWILVLLPHLILDIKFTIKSFILFIGFFIMKSSETELSNIRDISADKSVNNITLPIKYGITKINHLILIGEIISLLIIYVLIEYILIKYFIILVIIGFIILEYDVTNKNISKIMLYNRLLKLLLAIFVLIVINN